MRVPGSLALAAFIGGASGALVKFGKPALPPKQATQRPAHPIQKTTMGSIPPPPGYTLAQKVWFGLQYADFEFPLSCNGYPYENMTMEQIVALETATAMTKGGRRLPPESAALHAKHLAMKQKAKDLQETSKEEARMNHLSKVLKVPVRTPVEEEKDETPEQAAAPWPRLEHVEEASTASEMPAPVENALSAEQSRPAVQGEAQADKPKTVHDWKEETMNAFYRKKCNQMFTGLDTDDDGAVEEEEVYAFFDATWHDWNPSELTAKLLEEADENRDGKLSKPEWHVFAAESQKTSKGKAERWNPLEHLKKLVTSNPKADMEHNVEQLNGYYKRITGRLFHGIDTDTDDVVTSVELRAFLNKKFPMKDPAQFAEKVLAEADKDGDSKVTLEEFWSFAAESQKVSTNQSEKWNPLLHIINTVRRNKALDTVHIR